MRRLKVKVGERWYTVEVGRRIGNTVETLVDGDPVRVDINGPTSAPFTPGVPAAEAPQSNDTPPTAPGTITRITAPMPGIILSISVRVGDPVSAGAGVCVLEAMKMEQDLLAPADGTIKAIHAQQGQSVTMGQTIIELE